MDSLIIFGNESGYFQELAEIVEDSKLKYVSYFSPSSLGQDETLKSPSFLVAVGDPKLRKEIFEEALNLGLSTGAAIIHPSASISNSSRIGKGSHVNRLAVISSKSEIGQNCQINRSCSIGHNVKIGNHVSFGPGVIVCGNVEIGDGSLIGAGAVLLPGVKIGSNAIVGAGSVVTKDVGSGRTVKGNPAKQDS